MCAFWRDGGNKREHLKKTEKAMRAAWNWWIRARSLKCKYTLLLRAACLFSWNSKRAGTGLFYFRHFCDLALDRYKSRTDDAEESARKIWTIHKSLSHHRVSHKIETADSRVWAAATYKFWRLIKQILKIAFSSLVMRVCEGLLVCGRDGWGQTQIVLYTECVKRARKFSTKCENSY